MRCWPGISFLPTTLLVFTGSTQAPRLINRYGLRMTLTGGMLVATAGLMWLTQITAGGDYFVEVLPRDGPGRAGDGHLARDWNRGRDAGRRADGAGLASGLLNTSRLVGGALGLATLATIANARTRADAAAGPVHAAVNGYSLAFTVGGLFTVAGALAALTMLRPRRAVDAPAVTAEPSLAPAGAAIATDNVNGGLGSADATAQRRTPSVPRLRGVVGGTARASRRAAVGASRRRGVVDPERRVRR